MVKDGRQDLGADVWRDRRRSPLGLLLVVALGLTALAWAFVDTTDDDAPALRPVAERAPGVAMAERAPVAGAVADHWPIELVYRPRGSGERLRFRGNSWADWSVEVQTDDGGFRLVDRNHPSADFETEGGYFRAGEPTEPQHLRGPAAYLIPEWRSTVGLLHHREVVPLDQIPGAAELVAALGLTADDVEAYATANIAGCTQPLDDCVPDGEDAGRGIAHLPTGFPLFAEEHYGGDTGTWVAAESIRYGDPGIVPVPVDTIPHERDLR